MSKRTSSRRLHVALTLLLCMGMRATPAAAESHVLLPYPDSFDEIAAGTYDEDGRKVGNADLSVSLSDDQTVVMNVVTRGARSARNVAWAEMAVVMTKQFGPRLRLLRERSESFDEDGNSLGLMRIEHRQGFATCSPPDGRKEVARVDLPDEERVTNVPLQLLFLPLVRGDVERVDFQLFLCRGGPRVLEFAARVKGERPEPGSSFNVVEVQYRPELGGILSLLSRGFVPNLSFWFDANGNGTYLGHRMPLFSKGPEVMIVREGIAPELIHSIP